jgi:hypothetical protein
MIYVTLHILSEWTIPDGVEAVARICKQAFLSTCPSVLQISLIFQLSKRQHPSAITKQRLNGTHDDIRSSIIA